MGERRASGGVACGGGRPLKFWLGLRPVRQIREGILDGSLQTTKLPGQLRVSAEQAATEQPGSQARKVLLRQRDTLPLQSSHASAGRQPGRRAQQGKRADEADNQGDSTLPTKIKGVLQQHNPCQTKRAQASYDDDSHPEGHALRVSRGSARERPLPRVQPGLIGIVTVSRWRRCPAAGRAASPPPLRASPTGARVRARMPSGALHISATICSAARSAAFGITLTLVRLTATSVGSGSPPRAEGRSRSPPSS